MTLLRGIRKPSFSNIQNVLVGSDYPVQIYSLQIDDAVTVDFKAGQLVQENPTSKKTELFTYDDATTFGKIQGIVLQDTGVGADGSGIVQVIVTGHVFTDAIDFASVTTASGGAVTFGENEFIALDLVDAQELPSQGLQGKKHLNVQIGNGGK